jgi:hypothetical protein
MRQRGSTPELRAGDRAPAARLPVLGQGQARPAPAQGRLHRLQRNGRPYPQEPDRACRRHPDLIRKAGRKCAPRPRPHAVRKPKDIVFEKPGGGVQIDTPILNLAPGRTVKHFDAYDVFAKWTVAKPYPRATAADFLDKVEADMPWPIEATQIDGGSEFMAGFEVACRDRNLSLYVLPSRSPKLNRAVERCNTAWRCEFYATVDLPTAIHSIAEHVDAFQNLQNRHGPHGALDGLTPVEYLQTCRDNITQPSHMS